MRNGNGGWRGCRLNAGEKACSEDRVVVRAKEDPHAHKIPHKRALLIPWNSIDASAGYYILS